jgi:hypothetical protein
MKGVVTVIVEEPLESIFEVSRFLPAIVRVMVENFSKLYFIYCVTISRNLRLCESLG